MIYEAALPEWDYAANKAVFAVDSILTVWTRKACAAKGHPFTINNSRVGPESGVEDIQCLCGAKGFFHVYY